MLSDLFPLVAALALAACVYAWRERSRRRTEVRPPFPDITLDEAWRMWLAAPAAHPDRPLAPPGLDSPSESERRQVEADFAAWGQRGVPASPSLLRRAILDRAGTALLLEAILALPEAERGVLLKGYAPGMEEVLRGAVRLCALEWLALRWYARLKYDDAVPEDWFQHFLRLARPYVREKVRLAREALLQLDPGAGRFVEVYDALLDELRERSAKARAKRRFVPPDL